nr:hypothetical protein [Tanacetum cinerariifolium]
MFRLFKELTTSMAPEKVSIREKAKYPAIKNVNSTSLTRREEEKNEKNDVTTVNDIEITNGFNDSLLGVRVGNMKGKTYNLLPMRPVYEAILKKKIARKDDIRGNIEMPCNVRDVRLSLASHSYIHPLGIAEDVLVDVVGYVYLADFVILEIRGDEKRPFILGTPFMTIAKGVIKFDKGTITLRFGKSKLSFHRIPESLGNGYSQKDKNEAKTDKTEHGIGKSVQNQSRRRMHLRGLT